MRIFTSELETALGRHSSPSAKAAAALPVVQLMDSPMVRVPSHINIRGARQIAALKRTRHLLVTEGMHIIGLLWTDDWSGAPDGDPVWKWMRSSSAGVAPDTDAQVALRMMDRGRTSFLVVAAGALVLGIITEGRLRHAIATAAHGSNQSRLNSLPDLRSAG
ncbi:MAG TPA: CBS domain-containing protein [Polyangia bacterium]|jgi:CBS domain-containing protein|nr:CBS domain-containing protein [Polyangia bacterium]